MSAPILLNDDPAIPFSQAINILRPQFPIRDSLRIKLQTCAKTPTYFGTIPQDIRDIIATLVPDLRQSHPADPLKRDRQEYKSFAETYINEVRDANSINDSVPGYPVGNFDKLLQDFPDISGPFKITEDSGCFIKNTTTGVKLLHPFECARYAGNDNWIANIKHKSEGTSCCESNKYNVKYVQLVNPQYEIDEIYILPCGLIHIGQGRNIRFSSNSTNYERYNDYLVDLDLPS